MTARIERIGDRLGILLTDQELAELCLSENDRVELRPAGAGTDGTPVRPTIVYASTEEALAAYKRTEPRFAEAYRELAK